jgi:hypothetical protein
LVFTFWRKYRAKREPGQKGAGRSGNLGPGHFSAGDLPDEFLKNNFPHAFNEFDAADYEMPSAAYPAPGQFVMQLTYHAGNVHQDPAGTENSKVRAETEGDNRIARVSPANPVMDFTGCFTRWREGELMGMDLHVKREEECTVFQPSLPDMGHRGPHLLFDHFVGAIDKKPEKSFMSLTVPGNVQDVFYNFATVIEPEPELFIIKGEGDLLAVFFGVGIPHQCQEFFPFSRLAPVSYGSDGREMPDQRFDGRID